MSPREVALHIARTAIDDCRADRLVEATWGDLELGSGPVHIAAVGKAAIPMANSAIAHLKERCASSIVIAKRGTAAESKSGTTLYASHPVPDETSLAAGEAMLRFAHSIPEGESVLFLLSGGASALMEALQTNVALPDLQDLNRRLLASGSDIATINAERKKLSRIKAGGLGKAFAHAHVQVLAISDVYGDDLDVIGSGPMRAPGIPHRIIGNNAMMLRAAIESANSLGLEAAISPRWLSGEAREEGDAIAQAIGELPVMIYGGEPIVTLHGAGIGGRCQELALSAAICLKGVPNGAIAAIGSDGTDGPTEVAGAVVDGETVADRNAAEAALAANDSYAYLAQRNALVEIPQGMTNVNDIVVAVRL